MWVLTLFSPLTTLSMEAFRLKRDLRSFQHVNLPPEEGVAVTDAIAPQKEGEGWTDMAGDKIKARDGKRKSKATT